MRIVIALAVGIYLGRVAYRHYDRAKLRSELTGKMTRLLEQYLSREEAKKQVQEIFRNPLN